MTSSNQFWQVLTNFDKFEPILTIWSTVKMPSILWLHVKVLPTILVTLIVSVLITSLSLLSSEYSSIGNLEVATELNNRGIRESKEVNNTELYGMFVLLEGINLYRKENYNAAIDSITKSLPIHISNKDIIYEAAAYLYLGKLYNNSEDYEKSLYNFKKVDSIFLITNGLLPKCREAYNFLINDSKRKNDLNLQLYYTNQLLKFDNSLQDNYQYDHSPIIRTVV